MFTAIGFNNPGTSFQETVQSTVDFETIEEAVRWLASSFVTSGQIFDSVGLVGTWTVNRPTVYQRCI
jgi:hypothetical protein